MYNKELETDKKVFQQYVLNQKKSAAERLAKNSTWNKSHKKVKE